MELHINIGFLCTFEELPDAHRMVNDSWGLSIRDLKMAAAWLVGSNFLNKNI
ncbi:hypothetical protein [Neobacillus cucumis]|uniref:hypothetical protein n=1 Tax=Neobacillus cucumis TaxID=1740721 RepID=UPI0015E0FF44|nr:hypothetical protein [Neobacillus cucumis]